MRDCEEIAIYIIMCILYIITSKFLNLKMVTKWNEDVKRHRECIVVVYGHTTLKAPLLVRSAKLNNVGLG